jgi:hypothetical protein
MKTKSEKVKKLKTRLFEIYDEIDQLFGSPAKEKRQQLADEISAIYEQIDRIEKGKS